MNSLYCAGVVLLMASPLLRADDMTAAPPAVPTGSLAATPSSTAGDKTLLRLKLTPGQKFNLLTDLELHTTTVTGNRRLEMRQKSTVTATEEVLSTSADGDVRLRHTFGDSASLVEWNVGKGVWKANPEGPFGKPEKSGAEAMKGMSVEVTLSPQGRVLDVRGVSELVAAAAKAISAEQAGGDDARKMMLQALERNLNSKDRGSLQMSIPLPEIAVGIGQSWDNGKSVLQPAVSEDTSTRSTLEKRENGIVTINLLLQLSNPAKRLAWPGMYITQSGSGKGIIEVEESTGLTRSSDLINYGVAKYNQAVTVRKGRKDKTAVNVPTQIIYSRIHQKTTMVTTGP